MQIVSVVIPTWQDAATIAQTLDSIFAQTYTSLEVIVVNDGSTDTTREVLAPFLSHIQYVEQPNGGAPAARNAGAQRATGDYLLFCDADVLLRPDCIAKMVATLQAHPEVSFAYSSFRFGRKLFKEWPFDATKLRAFNFIHTTSLMRREHFPGFDVTLKRLQDWDMWLTMVERGHTGVWIPEELFQVRVKGKGISTWFPKILLYLPWRWIGVTPKRVAAHYAAVQVIKTKHHIN